MAWDKDWHGKDDAVAVAKASSTAAVVVPPVTSLVYNAYCLLETEMKRLRSVQASGGALDARQIKALVDALATAHKVETDSSRRARLGQLSDEELTTLLSEAQEALQ